VSIVSVERSLSKLKIIKTYLRSIMSQEKINKLVLLSIVKEILNEINYDNLINNFAKKNSKKNF